MNNHEDINHNADPLRLTMRGKVAATALAVVTGAGALTGCNALGASSNEKPHGTHFVTIEEGDTPWEIASEIDSSRTGAIVSEIEENPHNDEIFENGPGFGYEDIGKSLEVPNK